MNDDNILVSSFCIPDRIRCCFCDEKIVKKFMQAHLLLHMNGNPYKCCHFNCDAEFTSEYLLEAHFRFKHQNKKKKIMQSIKWIEKVYSMYYSKNLHTPSVPLKENRLFLKYLENQPKQTTELLFPFWEGKIDYKNPYDLSKVMKVEEGCKDPFDLLKVLNAEEDCKNSDDLSKVFKVVEDTKKIELAADAGTKREPDIQISSAMKLDFDKQVDISGGTELLQRAVSYSDLKTERNNFEFLTPFKKKNPCGFCNKFIRSKWKNIGHHILKHLHDESEIDWMVKCKLCDHTSVYHHAMVHRHLKRVHGVMHAVAGEHYIDKRKMYRNLIASKKLEWFSK